MPLSSASAIHPPYRRRDIGSPAWTKIGFPSGSPAISTHSSRPSPAAMILVSTALDTDSAPSPRIWPGHAAEWRLAGQPPAEDAVDLSGRRAEQPDQEASERRTGRGVGVDGATPGSPRYRSSM